MRVRLFESQAFDFLSPLKIFPISFGTVLSLQSIYLVLPSKYYFDIGLQHSSTLLYLLH